MLKCLIVDDEPIARMGMQRLCSRRDDMDVKATLGSAQEAYEYLKCNQVDLIFLDIQMPGISGIDLAGKLPCQAMVIFTTAYSEYALDAFDVDAIDYLVKPIDPVRFDRAVDKAKRYQDILNSDSDSIATPHQAEAPAVSREFIIVKADRRYLRIRIADILYIEGLKDYAIIHLPDRNVVTRSTIKGLAELLPDTGFIRVNKSNIANILHIDAFNGNDIFIGNREIAISPIYKESVLEILLNGH